MATTRVSIQFLEDLVFGYSANQVRIEDVRVDSDRQELVIEISGADVPDARDVRVICTRQGNRAGQSLITQTFEAVK